MNLVAGDSKQILKEYFGYDEFLPGQEDVIHRILKGDNLLVIMPTGGGKSLCYQLPALQLSGIVLVVSPLIALMKDQVDQLNSWGVPSTFINSSITAPEVAFRIKEVLSGKYRLVYVAPERFYSRTFLYQIKDVKIDLFVIDEAHCISEWGHDFRPSYLRLKKVAEFLTARSIVALTATATHEVREDIRTLLGFTPDDEIVTGFHRPNLFFMVHRIDREKIRMEKLKKIIQKLTGSLIIYAGTRKTVDAITHELSDDGYQVTSYHAGLTDEERILNQDAFLSGKTRIIVCTNAFGMGINKKDVRGVIHFNLPGSIEAYYQEAGRAGRDGKRAYCILLFGARDRYLQEFFIQGSYPPRELIEEIYRTIDAENEEIIKKTHEEILNQLTGRVNEMAVSSVLRILEEHGIIERLSERDHKASIKLLKDFDGALDSIDPRAEMQRLVLANLFEIYDQALYGGIQFVIDDLAMKCRVSRETFLRSIKALHEKELLSYNAPFRGRGIRMLQQHVDPEKLPVPYDALTERSSKEYDRLRKMEEYAYQSECRHRFFLRYFGENVSSFPHCESCDFCVNPHNPEKTIQHEKTDNSEKTPSSSALDMVSNAFLATIGRYPGRFGQKVIIDILKGSKNQFVRRWSLHNAPFYSFFDTYTREHLEKELSNLIIKGYVTRQNGMYPVLSLSALGEKILQETGGSDIKKELEAKKENQKILKDRIIINAIIAHGFDDRKLIKEVVGNEITMSEIEQVIIKIKKDFLDYLKEKYVETQ